MTGRYQVAVVGAGPAGYAAALSAARLGLETALIGPPHRPLGHAEDHRTAALFTGSIELLKNLGAWTYASGASEPIAAIRIIDDRGALLRAPEVLFPATEVGLEALGFNVPNAALVSALRRSALHPASNVTIVDTAGVARLEIGAHTVALALSEGLKLDADLVIAADGRRSLCREAAKISVRTWAYPQSAIVTSFSHERPHNSVSTEFHRAAGPLTTVPLPGRVSSLVWVERPDEAVRLANLDEAAFRTSLEARLQGLLGSIGTIGPRALFPLSGLTTETNGRARVALVGEAAHTIPPIGAQGLNLGLRDAAALADCLADALRIGRDIGGANTLTAFSAARRLDVASRVVTVDLLNRSLISGLLPVHLARGLGLHFLNSVLPLRRLVVREGLMPSHAKPTLMQPGGCALLDQRCGRSEVAA